MRENLPVVARTLGVDGDNDALATEHFCCLAYEIRAIDRSRIDGNFVGAGFEKLADIFELVDPSSNGERHEHLLSRPRDNVENDAAVLVRRGNVEEAKFVGPFAVVDTRDLNRITGVLEFDKL